jgi:hypothetical protein
MSRCACGFAGTVTHSWQPNRPIMAPIMAPHRHALRSGHLNEAPCSAFRSECQRWWGTRRLNPGVGERKATHRLGQRMAPMCSK